MFKSGPFWDLDSNGPDLCLIEIKPGSRGSGPWLMQSTSLGGSKRMVNGWPRSSALSGKTLRFGHFVNP